MIRPTWLSVSLLALLAGCASPEPYEQTHADTLQPGQRFAASFRVDVEEARVAYTVEPTSGSGALGVRVFDNRYEPAWFNNGATPAYSPGGAHDSVTATLRDDLVVAKGLHNIGVECQSETPCAFRLTYRLAEASS